MDEVATPDSSRIWLREDWLAGRPRELSKEFFRDALSKLVSDQALLFDSTRMEERRAMAAATRVPDQLFDDVSHIYRREAEVVCGASLVVPANPREEILTVLSDELGLLS